MVKKFKKSKENGMDEIDKAFRDAENYVPETRVRKITVVRNLAEFSVSVELIPCADGITAVSEDLEEDVGRIIKSLKTLKT